MSAAKRPRLSDTEEKKFVIRHDFTDAQTMEKFEEISTSLIERNDHKSSLWVSILSEKNDRGVMCHLFENDIIQILPLDASRHFINWMTTLKSRMKKILEDGTMRKSIDGIMSGTFNEKMTLGDIRVNQFLAEVGMKMFNTKKFEIFNEFWREFTLDSIRKMRGQDFKKDMDFSNLVTLLREITKPRVLQLISSFFPSTRHSMVSHVLINLLRFVLCFLLNTIRHVFHFDSEKCEVYYDGKFEGDVQDDEDSEDSENEEEQVTIPKSEAILSVEPSRKPNKRSLNNSDDGSQPPPTKIPSDSFTSSQMTDEVPEVLDNENSILKIEWEKLIGEASIWPFLTSHGPYHHIFSYLGNTVIKNRKFCGILRAVAWNIHQNALEFRKKEIHLFLKRINETGQLHLKDLMDFSEKMCRNVFRFKINNQLEGDVYEPGMVENLRSLFFKQTTEIEFGSAQDIYTLLKTISHLKQYSVTIEQLMQARNALVRYCFDLSLDLIKHITKMNLKVDPEEILIEGVNHAYVIDNEEAITGFTWINETSGFNEISSHSLERNRYKSSLWILIPCEKRKKLLEIALGYGITEQLPHNAKIYLGSWMHSVKCRIESIVENGYLRKHIQKIMSGRLHEKMKLNDQMLKKLLLMIGTEIFNTTMFKIFNKRWQKLILKSIRNIRDEDIVKDNDWMKFGARLCQITKPPVLQLISSFFPSSHQSMVSHVLINLLRFVLCFLLNTIRYIFHFDPKTFEVYYDGKFEGDDEEEDLCVEQETVLEIEGLRNVRQIDHQGIQVDSEHEDNEQRSDVIRYEKEPDLQSVQQNFPIQSIIEDPSEIVKNEEPEEENEVITNAPMLSPVRIQSTEPSHPNTPQDPGPARDLSSIPSTSTVSMAHRRRRHSTAFENEEYEPRNWREGYRRRIYILEQWTKDLGAKVRRLETALRRFE